MKFIHIIALLVMQLTCAAQDVVVLPMSMQPPAGAQKVGSVSAGNNSTQTKCDYEGLVDDLKEKARQMHGNVVKITQLVDPSFIGKCYKIKADVYKADDISAYQKATSGTADTGSRPHATIYLYRLRDTLPLITFYKVHLGKDSVIYTAHKHSGDTVTLYTEGPILLWADIEQRKELRLDVKFGGEYYVRCGLIKGEIRMVPVLELVDKSLGAAEFNKTVRRKNDVGVKYLLEVH